MRKVLAFVIGAAILLGYPAAVEADPLPVAYLTFDDGPSDEYTDLILDKMAEHPDVYATFFVNGWRVEKSPDALRRAAAAGHAIGNHTYNHVDLREVSTEKAIEELARTQTIVSETTGVTPSCYRPPYGRTNDTIRSIGSELGLAEQLWSVDTNDWRNEAEDIRIELDKTVPGAVVLMHDGPGVRLETLAAFSAWFDENKTNFRFSALPGCGGKSPEMPYDTENPTEWYRFDVAKVGYIAEMNGLDGFDHIQTEERYRSGLPLEESLNLGKDSAEVNNKKFLRNFYRSVFSRDTTGVEEVYWTAVLSKHDFNFFVASQATSQEMNVKFPTSKSCDGNMDEKYLCVHDRLPDQELS